MSSTLPPPSFIDDNASPSHRLPPSPSHIIHQWLNSTYSDTSSAYTGSFIDDGADMLLPIRNRAGFGAIDARFYKNRKRREDVEGGAWNEDIARAVGGDIGRNLGGLRGVGCGVEVRRVGRSVEEDGDNEIGERDGAGSEGGSGVRRRRRWRKGERKDTVTVPLPRRWGTIIIKDEGRVIVVDEEGEFDSGNKSGEEVGGEGKWIEAPPTISEASVRVEERKRRHKRRTKKVETLTTIPESEYEEVLIEEGGSDLVSPTDFFMTGGASGWPSPKPSSVAYSSDKSYGKPKSKSKKDSPVQSLPGSWPSPPQSPTKGKALSETSTDTSSSKHSWGKPSSHRSHRVGSRGSHSSSRSARDNVSTKTNSVYKPAAVEDATDTSSDNASKQQDVGWQDDHKGSEGWSVDKRSSKSASSKSSSKKGWSGGGDAWGNDEPEEQPTVQDWPHGRVKTVSDASSRASRHASEVSHTLSAATSHASRRQSQRFRTSSEASWDGYERPKTESEISIVGSDSERSWPAGRVSSRHSRETDVSRTYSRRSSRHGSQAGWGGSDGWGGSQTANVDGWGGRKMDSGSGIGRSDIDETSEDEVGDWSSLKIKVKSRRRSVDAWE